MSTSDRYAPPKTPLEGDAAPAAPAPPTPFPWLFVLRYVVGALVLIEGLASLYFLSQSWARLVDRAFIDPLSSPYRFLPMFVLKVATGGAMLAKRKLSLALTALWAVAFLYVMWGNGPLSQLGSAFFLSFGILVALFAFQCLLVARGLLR
ncbi:MAG TPA: hypothetical protein VIP05_23395 [Burkholderiaceae bacterium]